MPRLTILHLVQYFPPRHRYGTELITWHLAKAQEAQGHRVVVVAGESGRFARELSIRREDFDGLEVWRVYFNPRSRNAWLEHAAAGQRFGELLERLQPDLVHVQHLATLSLSMVRATRAAGIPMVLSLHDYGLVCARMHLLRVDGSRCTNSDLEAECLRCLRETPSSPPGARRRALARMLLTSAVSPRSWRRLLSYVTGRLYGAHAPLQLAGIEDLRARNEAVRELIATVAQVISPSADLARRFEHFAGLAAGRIRVVPHTVRMSVPDGARSSAGRGALRVGYVGKIAKHKGLHVLLGALRRLPAAPLALEVYGAPSWGSWREVAYYQEMRRLANGLAAVFHPRGFAPSDAARVYAGFDLLVVPSVWYENSPLVVAEAFAMGVPVLCSDGGGSAELVRDGIDGYHFRNADEADLARHLDRLAADRGELERLRAATPRARSCEDFARAVLELYREVLAS